MSLAFQTRIRRLVLGISLLAIAVCGAPVLAQQTDGSLDAALTALAQDISKFVKAEKEAGDTVNIKPFDGPAGAAAGAKISQSLRKQLEGKLSFSETGGYAVTGDYFGRQSPTGGYEVVLESVIKDAQGAKVQTLDRKSTR